MRADCRFRIARFDEAGVVADHVNACYGGPDAAFGWTPETGILPGPRTTRAAVAANLADPAARIVLCDTPGGLSGSVLIQRQDRAAYLGMFAVLPRLQGGGIGRALMAEAERLARALWPVNRMELTVISLQTALTGWYARQGYRETGERHPFPHDLEPGALRFDFDLIQMAKTLH